MIPTRSQSGRILPSLAIALFALLAFACFIHPVRAEVPHSEFGTVIGIGMFVALSPDQDR